MLVPFAACAGEACAAARRGLALRNLPRLLARLAPDGADAGDPASLTPPHERALAQAWGLAPPDGLVPLAALQLQQQGRAVAGEGWAWITPCHWRVARDHVRMAHPQELQLDADDSRALLAAVEPWFREDGIALEYEAPLRWLARGDIFRTLPSASLDRVLGRPIDPWLPKSEAGRPLRRLQQEMQMLLYTLPLNEERQRGGLLPVNSFWASGTGALPPGPPLQAPAGLQVVHSLRDAVLLDDWAAWVAGWQKLETRDCARLLAELEHGRPVRLTLCGESGWRSWSSAGASVWRRLFARPRADEILEKL